MKNLKPTKVLKEKKYTIREIFDWMAVNEETCKVLYEKVKKDKKIPKGAFPLERFCLVMFETQMDEYDNLKKY
jgi:hypothetical protein